jgi:hypothetical protein
LSGGDVVDKAVGGVVAGEVVEVVEEGCSGVYERTILENEDLEIGGVNVQVSASVYVSAE